MASCMDNTSIMDLVDASIKYTKLYVIISAILLLIEQLAWIF